jgi:AsmA protein
LLGITSLRQENIVGNSFKIILSSIAIILFLLIATICILPFVIDPNDFKPEIAAAVKDKTGRDLTLDGDIKLSLFPWIGISTGKIALSNASGFQDKPFATIEESHVKMLLLPLLSKKVEASRIVFKGLVLNLAKDAQGNSNWADLGGTDDAQAAAANATVIGKSDQPSALAAAAIGGIAIENAQINWNDLNAGQHIQITDLNLNTDKFTVGQPVGIAVSLNAINTKSAAIHAIKLNTELSVNQHLDIFTLSHSELQLTTSGDNIPGKSLSMNLNIADMAVNISLQTAKINGFQLKTGDMILSADLTGTRLIEQPSIQGTVTIAQFSPVKVLQQLAIDLPLMQDATALNKLSGHFDVSASTDSMTLQNLVMSLDDSQFKGSVTIKDFSQPAIHFLVGIDTLDVERYLPPAKPSSKSLASPSVLLAVGAGVVPVSTFRKLDVEGTLTLDKLKVNGLFMQDIHLNMNTKNGLLSTKQSIKRFYQGSYVGDLRYDVRGDTSVLAVNEKVDHLQLEPLLKDYKDEAKMSGIVDASARLNAQGSQSNELIATLNGQLSFLVKDSVIKGFNLQKMIDTGKSLIKGSALPADFKHDQTLFSGISGTATIVNGLIQNNDLLAKSSKLHIDGKGSLNLNSEVLDYKLDAKLLNSDVTAAEPEQVKAGAVINVTGTLDQPTYTLDIASLLTDKNKAKIEKLIDKLDKKLGPGVGDLLKNFLK